MAEPLSIGQCATLACVLEATAPKPGNVHRGADFEDLTYPEFLIAAVQLGPVFDAARGESLGRTVEGAVRVMRAAVNSNTHLGTILLLAPLAMAPAEPSLESGVARVLASLTADDSHRVYAAIRLAGAGSLGKVETADVTEPAPDDLVEAMRLAAGRDLVARQYAEGFPQVFGAALPWLRQGLIRGWSLLDAIVHVHVRLMSEFPDSLIARKCGEKVALESVARARAARATGQPGDVAYERALGDLDFWLRSDGHRRNPGTTADLVTAGLFAALRDGIIKPPFRLADR